MKSEIGRFGLAGVLFVACGPGVTTVDTPTCADLEEGEICLLPRGSSDDGSGSSDDGSGSSDDGSGSSDDGSGSSDDGADDDGSGDGPSDGDSDGGTDGAEGGAAGASSAGGEGDSCLTLRGVIRDFRRGDRPGGHPDFETYTGDGESGLVASKLASDGIPRLAKEAPEFIESPTSFAFWYRDDPETNAAFDVTMQLEKGPDGGTEFGSDEFFPLDDLGFGNQDHDHNFGFTTEMHAKLFYDGQEDGTFTFTGDDDLWVFVAGRLVIDLGGVHAPATASFDLAEVGKELGLEPGGTYPLDLFHAERHSGKSSFRVTTTLRLVDCEND